MKTATDLMRRLAAERNEARAKCEALQKEVDALKAELDVARGTVKRGRKARYNYKLSEKDDEFILDALARHLPMWAMAERIGCSRPALANYIHGNPILQQAYTESKDSMDDLAEHKLFEKIQNGDLNALTFYMPRQMRHRGYGDHQVIEQKNDEQRIVIGHIPVAPEAVDAEMVPPAALPEPEDAEVVTPETGSVPVSLPPPLPPPVEQAPSAEVPVPDSMTSLPPADATDLPPGTDAFWGELGMGGDWLR